MIKIVVFIMVLFNISNVDPAINPNQFSENLIYQAILLDDKLKEQFEKTYTDEELKFIPYNILLYIDENLVKRKLDLFSQKEQRNELISLSKAIAKEQNVSPTLLISIIQIESHFRKNVISKSGAKGLCQIMPFNFKSLNIKDPFDTVQNIRGGCKYLNYLLDRFNGNITLVLAAYNAGPFSIKNNKVPPFKETRNYIKKVIKQFQIFKKG